MECSLKQMNINKQIIYKVLNYCFLTYREDSEIVMNLEKIVYENILEQCNY